MSKLIVANWKANPKTFTEALKLVKASDFENVVIAPPYIYLQTLSWVLKKAALGAQDTFWENAGPYTGEVTPSQIKNLKVKYVIIGHSERRGFGETDEMINKKIKAALKVGLRVILCVGEDWNTRRKGIAAAKQFVGNQLKKDLLETKNLKIKNKNLLIAYEPVWAIGTGKADSAKTSAEMISYIKKILDSRYPSSRAKLATGHSQILKTKVLYGGSVTPKNAKAFLSQPEIDGALVGGASLNQKEFRKIINAQQ
ncbi:MAG: triose-phosphate isomerase [Candidatus Colwellbacteria bacterium]|nr:triose-phosphate isomerase [Candidatus Colwellbacteria bacterium]